MRRVFDAFVYYEAGQDPMQYYLTVEAPTQVIGTAFVVATVIVGDIILVSIPVFHYSTPPSLTWLNPNR